MKIYTNDNVYKLRFNFSDNNNEYAQHLNLEYIGRSNSIFCVRGISVDALTEMGYGHREHSQSDCALYSLNTNEWTSLPAVSYDYDPNGNNFSCNTCYDGDSAVYLWSHSSEQMGVLRLDLNGTEWQQTGIEFPPRTGCLWMETPHVLCVSDWNIKTVHCLDLRVKQKTWTQKHVDSRK